MKHFLSLVLLICIAGVFYSPVTQSSERKYVDNDNIFTFPSGELGVININRYQAKLEYEHNCKRLTFSLSESDLFTIEFSDWAFYHKGMLDDCSRTVKWKRFDSWIYVNDWVEVSNYPLDYVVNMEWLRNRDQFEKTAFQIRDKLQRSLSRS